MNTTRPPRLIPGLVDAQGQPLAMPYDEAGWRAWYDQVLLHRIRAMRATEGTDKASLLAREAHRAFCRQPGPNGRLYWLLTFGWILEPRNEAGAMDLPFMLYPRQVELIDEYESAYATPAPSNDANLAVIKSRDVGGTWIDAADSAWRWQFEERFFGMVISSDADLAFDWDNPKSYFFKVKYLLQSQPAWLLPRGFAGFHHRSPHAKEGILINPATKSTFTGSTTTPDAGRGNRLGKVTVDEAGTLDEFDAIYNNLQNVTDHTIVISSAHVRHGMGLYNLVHGKEGYTPPRLFYFRWNEIPGRDEDWYRAKKSTMKDDEFQREVEMNWLAGSGDFAFPAILAVEPGHFPYVPGWQTYVSIDDGYDQDFAISWWQTDLAHGRLRCIAAYANSKLPIRYYGFLMTGQPSSEFRWGEEERRLMAWLREYTVFNAVYTGDRHGDNTDLSSGVSPFEVLSTDFGLMVTPTPDPQSNNLKYRLDLVSEHIPHMDFDQDHGAPLVLESLKISRHRRHRPSAQPTTEVKGLIHHGNESHFRTTVDYLLMFVRHSFRGGSTVQAGPLPRSTTGGFDPRRTSGRRFGSNGRKEQLVGAGSAWESPW